MSSGWPETSPATTLAVAGVRAPMKTAPPCTGGSTGSNNAFCRLPQSQRAYARGRLATGASSATSSCGGVLRPSWEVVLQRALGRGVRGKRRRSSLGGRSAAQWAWGRPRRRESKTRSPAAEGGRRARSRRCRASGGAWFGEGVEDDVAELVGTTEGRGGGCGRGGSHRRRRPRSVEVRGSQRRG